MQIIPIKAGTADVSVILRFLDSTDGTPELAVSAATAGLVLEYRRELGAETAITPSNLVSLTTAHSDGAFGHIGDGYYRLDVPDAAFASSSAIRGVLAHGIATDMVVVASYVTLTGYDPYDSVRAGLTALPNAAADAAGGLPISDAGGLDMDAIGTNAAGANSNAVLATTAANAANSNAILATTAANAAGSNALVANSNAILATTAANAASSNALVANSNAILANTTAGAASSNALLASTAASAASSNAVLANTAASAASSNALVANSNAILANTTAGSANSNALLASTAASAASSNAVLANTAASAASSNALVANSNALVAVARLPAALIDGRMDATASAINNVAEAAARIARSTQGIVLGTVGSSSTTSNIVTSSLSPAAGATNQFQGRIVTFEQGTTTANLRGQSTDITASTAGGQLVVTPLTTAPVSGDVFVIT